MTLKQYYDFLNFWIDKEMGSFYPPEELDLLVDRSQMSYFNDCYDDYGKNQRLNSSLVPFKATYQFSNSTSPAGLITMPVDEFYLLDAYTVVVDSTTDLAQRKPVPFPNEDERTYRMNSQLIPNTVNNPFGERIGVNQIQLYPQQAQAGVITYLRRPAAPRFAYDLVSGRVIVFAEGESQNLEWQDKDVTAILVRALASIGINMDQPDIAQWADMRSAQNNQPGGIKL